MVCAYGENPYVERTIESLERQLVGSNIKLSTSTPSDYLREICERHAIEMLVNKDGGGAGADWNFAYDHAGTALVTLAHQDDYYEPQFTKRVLEAANDRDARPFQLIYTDYYELRNDERVDSNALLRIKRIMNAPLKCHALRGSRFVKRRVLSLGDPICCPAVTLNREVVDPTVFDTTYINSCDYKTWVDLASLPGKFIYVPEKLMGHRIYAGSSTTKNLQDDIRRNEDMEILSLLWPRPIAGLINRVYALSEKSNEL